MAELQYISYASAHDIPSDELVVVDCHYHRGLVLSHLYSRRSPSVLQANTSTETALNFLALSEPARHQLIAKPRFVTCNHWDIDGFLAVWSLINPELALQHAPLLSSAAMLGDFREFDHTSEIGISALRFCALLNKIESTEFCLPFGDLEDATIEWQVAERKFAYFLPRFADWLLDLDSHDGLWRSEQDSVTSDLVEIRTGAVQISELSNGISIIETARPLHYYAAFSSVRGGAVLTLLPSYSYAEFEYRYETRVGRVDKPTISRVDLSNAATELTALETDTTIRWVFDNILEGGPILRPEFADRPLSHADRYQSLSYRLERGLCPKSTIALGAIRWVILKHLGIGVAEQV